MFCLISLRVLPQTMMKILYALFWHLNYFHAFYFAINNSVTPCALRDPTSISVKSSSRLQDLGLYTLNSLTAYLLPTYLGENKRVK